jgi:ABC-type transport system involved in multi-copper enzyme maturation permease subunit
MKTKPSRRAAVGQNGRAARTDAQPRPAAPPDRPAPSRWRARWHAISVVGRRDLLGTLAAPGIYVAVALGMVGALVVVRGHVDAIGRNRILILSDAFSLPFFVAITIGMLFLALGSVATIAREREAGTLETLFYGPVDYTAYVLAKHVAQVAAFAVMSVWSAVLLLSYASLSGLRLGLEFVPEVVLSLFAAAAVAALGLFVSACTRGARAAFGLFFAAAALFLGIRVGAEALSGIPVTNNFSPLLFVRGLFIGLDAVLGYASPFAVFEKGVDAVVRGSVPEYLAMLGLSCLHVAVLLTASIRLLDRRGVRR